jgi:integrase
MFGLRVCVQVITFECAVRTKSPASWPYTESWPYNDDLSTRCEEKACFHLNLSAMPCEPPTANSAGLGSRFLWLSKSLREEQFLRRLVTAHEFAAKRKHLIYIGMRYSEQYNLRWEDVGLTRKQITLQKTKAVKRQIVRLNASAIRALEKLGPKTSGPVCPDDSWAHRVWWEAVLKQAKVVDFYWHDLRHTFAWRLVTAGVDIFVVSKLMRHGSVAVTERLRSPGSDSPRSRRRAPRRGCYRKYHSRPRDDSTRFSRDSLKRSETLAENVVAANGIEPS